MKVSRVTCKSPIRCGKNAFVSSNFDLKMSQVVSIAFTQGFFFITVKNNDGTLSCEGVPSSNVSQFTVDMSDEAVKKEPKAAKEAAPKAKRGTKKAA